MKRKNKMHSPFKTAPLFVVGQQELSDIEWRFISEGSRNYRLTK